MENKFKPGDFIWIKRDRTRKYNRGDISEILSIIPNDAYEIWFYGQDGFEFTTHILIDWIDQEYELVPELAKALYL